MVDRAVQVAELLEDPAVARLLFPLPEVVEPAALLLLLGDDALPLELERPRESVRARVELLPLPAQRLAPERVRVVVPTESRRLPLALARVQQRARELRKLEREGARDVRAVIEHLLAELLLDRAASRHPLTAAVSSRGHASRRESIAYSTQPSTARSRASAFV